MLTIPTPQMRKLRLKELRPLAVRPLSWGHRASKWWNLDTDPRLSGSKASTSHRASHGTFTKQKRQVTVNHSLRAHSSRRTYLLSASLSSIFISRASLYKQAPAGNTMIMQQEITGLATPTEFWVYEYINWAPELPSAPNSDKSAYQGKSRVSYAQTGAQELSLEGQGTGTEEGASIHFPRKAEPRGGSLVTCTVALLVHAHFRPRPSSSPPESVLGWKVRKRQTD